MIEKNRCTVADVVRTMIKEKKTTQKKLADRIGLKNQSNIAMFLQGSDRVTVRNLLAMLNGLDCDLLVKNHATGQTFKVVPDRIGSDREIKD